jgi:hypothetical protein
MRLGSTYNEKDHFSSSQTGLDSQQLTCLDARFPRDRLFEATAPPRSAAPKSPIASSPVCVPGFEALCVEALQRMAGVIEAHATFHHHARQRLPTLVAYVAGEAEARAGGDDDDDDDDW